MKEQLPNSKNQEENLDDENVEESYEAPCPYCNGDGQVFFQDDLCDEEDRSMEQCPACGGSGILPEEDEEDYSFLDEN